MIFNKSLFSASRLLSEQMLQKVILQKDQMTKMSLCVFTDFILYPWSVFHLLLVVWKFQHSAWLLEKKSHNMPLNIHFPFITPDAPGVWH